MKSNKLITTAAADYLLDDPDMWHRFIMALTESLGRDENLRLVFPTEVSVDDTRPLLTESALEILMDPQIADTISQCQKESDARDIIVDSLCQKFDDLRISDNELDENWGHIVDLADVYDGHSVDVRTGDAPEEYLSADYGSSNSGIHSFRPYMVKYQPEEIRALVVNSFEFAKNKSIPGESRLIRLDIVNSRRVKA